MATMRAALVSPEREIWTGTASMVVARTLDGEIGVQPGHVPLLGVLAEGGEVRIFPDNGGAPVRAVVDGGFLSVSSDGVSVLAESAELAAEIDVEKARAALSGAEPGSVTERRAQGRLRVAEQA